jgi:NAD+ synthase (glutamine-hydrolysing)
MPALRVASAFVNTTPFDWQSNQRAILHALELASKSGADLVCLPELCITGYGCEDRFFSSDLRLRALDCLQALLPSTKNLAVALGLPFEFEGFLYNCAALCVDGQLKALVPKQHLAKQGLHYEPRWFEAWKAGRRERIQLLGADVALGDWIFDLGGNVFGFEICEDAWVEERPAKALKARGAKLILSPSASHFALGKTARRERLARESGCAYVYANLMGNEAGRAIYDGGAMILDSSAVLKRGQRFSYESAGVLCADLELDDSGAGEGLLELGPLPKPGQPGPLAAVLQEDLDEYQEFTQAVALGLSDYLRKSKSKGFMLSLSGGADSAACAALILAARKYSGQALALTCVYQKTANSSKTTQDAAKAVAEAVGAEFFVFDIEPLVKDYLGLAEKALGRELKWESDDATLQNLQARVRSPGVWALANAKNCLLLATNNRSEAAAGYSTMDGDSSGGLAPLAGIGKDFIRAWLRWLEKGWPLPALRLINAQEPTAELRPLAAGQTDEADLMPYAVLDSIETLSTRDAMAPLAIFDALPAKFPQHSQAQLGAWVLRYFELWSRSQWKRERLAPSFHLDDHNVDPRSWHRFPILSGSFEAECEALRKRLAAELQGKGRA